MSDIIKNIEAAQLKAEVTEFNVGDTIKVYGKIKEVNEATILMEVADNVRIKVDKNSVYVAVEDAQQAATTK